MKKLLLLLVLPCCIAACSSNKAKQQMKITVEMDVFSGRPNPSWETDSLETADLLKQLSLLQEVEQDKAALNDGLGYRGFIITVADTGSVNPSLLSYRVYKGFVLMNEHAYSDSHSIEKQLVEKAKTRGFGDIIEALRLAD